MVILSHKSRLEQEVGEVNGPSQVSDTFYSLVTYGNQDAEKLANNTQ